MSRLDSFIRRMSAQRDVLNSLVAPLQAVEGVVLEFGLGSGRTLDHLRERYPGRRILVFERDPGKANMPDTAPAELVRGDIRDTTRDLPDGCAALIHADIDTGQPQVDVELTAWLPTLAARLLTPSGIVASSVHLSHPLLGSLALPPSVADDRYHLAHRRP